tara:strand:+ start:98 stop:490 length:393 start_codon:yes stop_codon:yes gene_type:complete
LAILNTQKVGKIFTVCSGSLSQSIGRGRISREGALDVRESRERRDNIVPFFSPEKRRENAILIYLAAEIFHFFEQDRLLCARVDISVTKSPTKTAEKEFFSWGSLRFFFQKWPAHPVFSGEFSFFWPRQN